VTLRVEYDERAINQAAGFLDDLEGIRAALDAIDQLRSAIAPGIKGTG
jgi:hypothetical protein